MNYLLEGRIFSPMSFLEIEMRDWQMLRRYIAEKKITTWLCMLASTWIVQVYIASAGSCEKICREKVSFQCSIYFYMALLLLFEITRSSNLQTWNLSNFNQWNSLNSQLTTTLALWNLRNLWMCAIRWRF